MSVLLITGNHPRHSYLAHGLNKTGMLVGWVREVREAFVPSAPAELPTKTAELFDLHFARREEAEAAIFGAPALPEIPIHETSHEDLNSSATIEFAKKHNPRLVLSYGCHKLSAGFRNEVDAVFWNTHGGLSPEYRGVITHFWPSFMLEPQMTGVTLHETTDHLDGGAVIHQSGAVMHRGDGVHMLAGRTVKNYVDELSELLPGVLNRAVLPEGETQKSTGKLWTSSDWRPEHLHSVYDHYEDRIVDMALDGKIEGRMPNLITCIA